MVQTKRTLSTEKTKSFTNWGKLDKETLTLKCNQYNLMQTGSKIEMRRRLYNFFKNNDTTSSPMSSSSEAVPQEITENQTVTPELLISSPVTSSQQRNQPSPIPSETSQLREKLKELKTMMLAMQHRSISQHESVGNMSMTTPIPETEAPSQPFLLPSLNHNIAPITDDQSRLHTFQPHQLQLHPSSDHPAISHSDQNNVHFNIGTNQYGTTGPGNFTNNIVNNLYTPPTVDEKIMTKTLKAEYVDFDTLLPTSIPTTDQQLIGIHVISEDNFNIITNHKPKNKITDFPSWMCAWNLFTQAALYNHPHQQHNLFSYQKHFCYLIRRFKFEACYSYDKAQRKQIATQIRVPSTSRTAMWDQRNEELYNIFLMDSSSHLPTCYICKNTGHYSSYCPQKQSDNLPFTRTRNTKTTHTTQYKHKSNLWVAECDQPTKP